MPLPSSTKKAEAESQEGQRSHAGKLTRGNLRAFTAAERRERAHQRGRSTPSPEPELHALESEDSYVPGPGIPPEVIAYSKTLQSTIPRSKPLPGLKPAPRWHAEYRDLDDEFCGKKGAPQSVYDSQGTGRLESPDHEFEQEESINRQPEHDPVDGWDNVPADSPNGHNSDSHDAGIPPDMHSNHREHHARPSILHTRPAIPRQSPTTTTPDPRFPPDFPAYHCTQNMNEIAAYLANASYVASLGGPPLADLKYGIIIVPVGEEHLLFGRRQAGNNFVMTQEFLDAVDDANRDYDRALRMHDADGDSAEFVRGRFEGGFGSVEGEELRNVEVGVPLGRDGESEEGKVGGGKVVIQM